MYTILHLPRSNSKTFKPLYTFETLEACKAKIDEMSYQNAVTISKPYIFTSILINYEDGKQYRVTQDFKLDNGQSIPVSPEKLYQALTNY